MITTPEIRAIGSASILCACALLGASLCQAGPAEEPFYHQFIDLNERAGYQPTRSFTVVTDPEQGNRLVAEDDPDLRFNVMWMDQFQPGYRVRKGGAAFGQLFRGYIRTLYNSYRANNAGNGLLSNDSEQQGQGYTADMDYDLRVSDDEVKFRVKYTY